MHFIHKVLTICFGVYSGNHQGDINIIKIHTLEFGCHHHDIKIKIIISVKVM
jgi:hypothetical protein